MQLTRPAIALHPALFGKAPTRGLSSPRRCESSFGADLKLFAATFVAGFLVASILIA